MNDIALITIKTLKPLKYDDYCENRLTGSLILIDENTFETVGAGMIVTDEEIFSFNIWFHYFALSYLGDTNSERNLPEFSRFLSLFSDFNKNPVFV